MTVVYTDQCYESLDEITRFLLEDREWSLEEVLALRSKLLDKADELEETYPHYQEEEYLSHLGKGHRRSIEGYFKIIYLVEGTLIHITDFFDTRQDPKKMKG